jgi:glutathione S-transferase
MKNDYILFLNIWEGLGFVLKRKLEQNNLEVEYFNSKDNPKEFKKRNVKSTPVLITFDNGEITGRLTGTDDIVEYLKEHVSNNKTQVGRKE